MITNRQKYKRYNYKKLLTFIERSEVKLGRFYVIFPVILLKCHKLKMEKNMMKKILKQGVVNKTGEIIKGSDLVLEYEYKQDNYKNNRKSNDYIVLTQGHYFHLFYGKVLEKEYEHQMVVRLLKLCCKIDYNNNIKRGMTSKYDMVASIENLMTIWNLSKRETIITKQYLTQNKLISINHDKKIQINMDYAKKGKVKTSTKIKGKIKIEDITRVFQKGYCQLYDGVKPIQHKKLYIFIRILPYVNIYHNILCENPYEEEVSKIVPITWTRLGRKMNLKKQETKRLRSDIWNLQINNKPAIAEFKTLMCGKCIIINPSICYKGNKQEHLRSLDSIFDISDKKMVA